MSRFQNYSFKRSFSLVIKRVKLSLTLTLNLPYISYSFSYHNHHTFTRANMAPSKRVRSVTFAKSPPKSPIRPITKRPQQKTPEPTFVSSFTLPLPLRPTRPTSTFTPTAFNSSQIDSDSQSESEESSKSESEEESKSKKEDNITRANEYLDQDLKELGPDRLDREDINESDINVGLPTQRCQPAPSVTSEAWHSASQLCWVW
jgi:hypothetical protein